MMATAAAPRGSQGLIERLRRLNAVEAALLAEAFIVLAGSSAAIRFLPFTQVGRLASWPLGKAKSTNNLPAKVVWAVLACARRAPWRAVCFQQGLTAQIMLRRRGVDSTLYFGAAVDKDLTAHVWVKAGERDVVGCEEAAGYAVLATFPATPNGPRAAGIEGQGRFDPIRP